MTSKPRVYRRNGYWECSVLVAGIPTLYRCRELADLVKYVDGRQPTPHLRAAPAPPSEAELDRPMGWLTDPHGLDWGFIERHE